MSTAQSSIPRTAPHAASRDAPRTERLVFGDNALAMRLFGPGHSHLARIEHGLGVSAPARGNEVLLEGPPADVDTARRILTGLYGRLEKGLDVLDEEVLAAIRMAAGPGPGAGGGGGVGAGIGGAGGGAADEDLLVSTGKKKISPRSPVQAAYLRAVDEADLVFGLGPAGAGKTYLAVAKAVERLINGAVSRIILSRPAVEAGEQLGFLPGDMREKVDPYLRPLYDALHDMLPGDKVAKRLESGEIEVAPLAFMRGRTLSDAFVILDEAQNTTAVQMKMFLTRLGEGSRMVVTGDLTQVDLPRGIRSGLRDAVDTLSGVEGVRFVEFSAADVVRHPLVGRIVSAYDEVESRLRRAAPYESGEGGGQGGEGPGPKQKKNDR